MAAKAVTVVLVIAIVALAGLFGFYYVNTSSTISMQNSTITSQSQSIQGDIAKIAADNSQIASLNGTISTDDSQIAALNSQVSNDTAKIQSLTTGFTNANSTIATLQAQIASDTSKMEALTTQVNGLKSQVTGLQSAVAELTSVISLSGSTSEYTSEQVQVGARANTSLVTFTANYPGYVVVNMTAVSDMNHVGFTILDSYSSEVVPSHYSGIFLGPYGWSKVPDFLPTPVVSGTVTVYIVNLGIVAGFATVSVTYYY